MLHIQRSALYEQITHLPLPETILEWIEDLESGKFSQSKGSLKSPEGHCCLGVWCEGRYPYDGEDFLYDGIHFHAGLPESGPFRSLMGNFLPVRIDGIIYGHLAEMNDKGFTFREIAAFCRVYPRRVFHGL